MTKEFLIRLLYHSIIVTTGFTTLALGILTSRALVPHVGTTVYVWGGLLVVSLMMIVLGYMWGEFSSERIAPEKKPRAYLRRAMAAAFFVLFASFFQYSVNVFLHDYSPLIGAIVGSFVILGPSLFFTATLTPLLVAMELHVKEIKFEQKNAQTFGKLGSGHAGIILAEGTLGAVIGAFVCTYILLPSFAVDTALALIVLPVLIAVTITAFIHRNYTTSGLRSTVVGLLVCGLGLFSLGFQSQAATQIRLGAGIVEQKEVVYTPYGAIRILKTPAQEGFDPEYYWLMDGSTQGAMLENGQHRTSYTNAIVNTLLNAETHPEDILLLGGGAGLIARDLYLAGRNVTVVDIVKDAKRLANAYFGLPADVPYIHQDARVFLNRCDKKYDAIIVDLYGAFSFPDNSFTKEAFEQAKNCLVNDGLVLINMFRMESTPTSEGILNATLKSVFPYVELYSNKQGEFPISNGLWIASRMSLPPIKLYGGSEPDAVYEELREKWFYVTNIPKGKVSTDALPRLSLALEPIMRKTRNLTLNTYGFFVMQP